MQRAPDAAGEPGAVEEDAGIVDEAGDRGRLAVVTRLARAQEAAAAGLGVELHLVRSQAHERLDDVGDVVVVDEVGAVAAAPLGQFRRRRVEHPLAPLPVDAAVVRAQERGVEHPCALLLGILEADPLVQVVGPARGHRRHHATETPDLRRTPPVG